jgi:tRNA-guanine family transglycosylase
VLTSIHNVHFYQRIVREAREAIIAGHFDEHRREFLASYFGETSNSGEGSNPVETSET